MKIPQFKKSLCGNGWFPTDLLVTSFAAVILLELYSVLAVVTVWQSSFLDALFTSTSAVCVTGLTVVDTGTEFTTLARSSSLC